LKLKLVDKFSKNTLIIKSHKNPSRESRVVPCGLTDREHTDMMRLTVAFPSFENAPENHITKQFPAGFIVLCQ
jgi:hypothetical protein